MGFFKQKHHWNPQTDFTICICFTFCLLKILFTELDVPVETEEDNRFSGSPVRDGRKVPGVLGPEQGFSARVTIAFVS